MELRGCAEGQSSTMTDASSPPTARRRPSDEKARALATGSLASLSASSPAHPPARTIQGSLLTAAGTAAGALIA